MLPLLATYASTTALPALASAAVFAETLLATSTPTLLIGFAAGAYMTNSDNFKGYFSKLLAPTKAQISSSVVKAIILDGAITYHFTHDPIASAKAAVTALPSYFIRTIHDDPATACVVGAGKYASGGKSVIAGCVNHALYNKQFDKSEVIGDFLFTTSVEAVDHCAKKIFTNKTLAASDAKEAAVTGIVSAVAVTGNLIPALDHIELITNSEIVREYIAGAAIDLGLRTAVFSYINEEIIGSTDLYTHKVYDIANKISEILYNKTSLSGESQDSEL